MKMNNIQAAMGYEMKHRERERERTVGIKECAILWLDRLHRYHA